MGNRIAGFTLLMLSAIFVVLYDTGKWKTFSTIVQTGSAPDASYKGEPLPAVSTGPVSSEKSNTSLTSLLAAFGGGGTPSPNSGA